jgi:hypothetical protein
MSKYERSLIHRGVSSFYGFIKNLLIQKFLVSRNRHYRPQQIYIAEKRKNGLKVTPTHITLATASSR